MKYFDLYSKYTNIRYINCFTILANDCILESNF